jgi:hypothetical protein
MSCVLCDGIEIKPNLRSVETTEEPPAITRSQVIRAHLRPGDSRVSKDYFRGTTFTDHAAQERYEAWGCVSYTVETDFRYETTEDCIVFFLFVKPETFALYAAKISYGAVDEMILRVSSVAGFYSEWSPSISTDNVKVLTKGDQKVTLTTEAPFEPPRLGKVGEAALYINRRLELGNSASAPQEVGAIVESETKNIEPETRNLAEFDTLTLQMLVSLRCPLWFIVVFAKKILDFHSDHSTQFQISISLIQTHREIAQVEPGIGAIVPEQLHCVVQCPSEYHILGTHNKTDALAKIAAFEIGLAGKGVA